MSRANSERQEFQITVYIFGWKFDFPLHTYIRTPKKTNDEIKKIEIYFHLSQKLMLKYPYFFNLEFKIPYKHFLFILVSPCLIFLLKLNSNYIAIDVCCMHSKRCLQTHHAYSTLKRRGNGRFHVVSTWNTCDVFMNLKYL